MYWPMLLWQQYLFSGDDTLLRTMAPRLERFLPWLKKYQDPNSKLIDPLGWRISEYAGGNMPSGGYSIATACQYYENLRIASRVFSVLGLTEQSNTYLRQAEEVNAGINSNLFNGEFYLARTDRKEMFPLASAWALRFDIVPEAAKSKVLAAIEKAGKPDIGGYGGDAFYSGLLNAGGGDFVVRDLVRGGGMQLGVIAGLTFLGRPAEIDGRRAARRGVLDHAVDHVDGPEEDDGCSIGEPCCHGRHRRAIALAVRDVAPELERVAGDHVAHVVADLQPHLARDDAGLDPGDLGITRDERDLDVRLVPAGRREDLQPRAHPVAVSARPRCLLSLNIKKGNRVCTNIESTLSSVVSILQSASLAMGCSPLSSSPWPWGLELSVTTTWESWNGWMHCSMLR